MKKVCSYCGGNNHYAFQCYRKRSDGKHKSINKESKTHKRKRAELYHNFFRQNPPDEQGGYVCYLNISKDCPGWVMKEEVSLEHVFPRSSYPEVRYNILNIKPSCWWCNQLKGSNTPYGLAYLYPQMTDTLKTDEWREWEGKIQPYLHRSLPSL